MKEVRVNCPLCAWYHVVPELDPHITVNSLAGVFGPGVMLASAQHHRDQQVEKAIEEHLNTHTLVEWLKKVTSLQTRVDQGCPIHGGCPICRAEAALGDSSLAVTLKLEEREG